jgi:hypothetical protein
MKASRPQHVREAKTRAELGAVHFLFEGCRNFVRKDAFGHYRWQKTHFFVKRDHGPPEESAESFHTTGGAIVVSAAQSQARGAKCALVKIDERIRTAFEALVIPEKGGWLHESGG